MSELMEQPVLIIAIGVVTVIIMISGLIKTGHKGLIFALIAAILLFGGLLAAERMIKTDREQIRETLLEAAAAVERNDVDGVLQFIHSSKKDVRSRVRTELPRRPITSVRITQIREIRIGEGNSKKATAEFFVRIEGTYGKTVRFATVDFRPENGQWKVFDFEHQDFHEGR